MAQGTFPKPRKIGCSSYWVTAEVNDWIAQRTAGVGRGLRRAARTAREVARMHGTPIYVWEDGKVVAKKP